MTQTAVATKEQVRSKEAGPANPLLAMWQSVIGKKIVMAVTGAVLVLFVLAHMAGNLKIFGGPEMINTYSRALRETGMPELGYGQLLWIVRIVLITCVLLHIIASYQLTMLNRKARRVGYESKKDVETSLGALTMRWSGVLVLIFVIFHILHFTLGVVGFQPGQFEHLAVYHNVVAGFMVWPIAVFYIIAMAALCLHLDHGIWSGMQTLGWNTTENQKRLRGFSRVIAIIIFIGFILTPVSVMAGWIR